MAKKQSAVIEAPEPLKTKKLMNKSQRCHLVHPDDVISGGLLSVDKKYSSILPGKTVELKASEADRLLSMFPTELIDLNA